MTSSRPYLVRAIHEWIVDNDLTPQLIVNAGFEGVSVPRDFVQDGKIVLNVSGSAVRNLQMSNEWVSFEARFGGRPHSIQVPVKAVMAVYAAESGVGMAFQDDGDSPEPGADPPGGKPERPSLKVVK